MLTVVLATYNGGETLPKTLEGFVSLQAPAGGWKLVVVDNNSSDDTQAVLERYSGRLPLSVLFEQRRGKNVALNQAIPYFEGDLVVFTDDDVVVPSDWLLRYRQLADEQPGCAIFGGRVAPLWPTPPPAAILEGVPLGPAFAVHPEAMEAGAVSPSFIWGPNMMVRRAVFDAGHRFNEAVGPSAHNYIMGSETEFTQRVSELGHACCFAPEIVVGHIIREEQLSLDWLRGRAFRFGRHKFYGDGAPLGGAMLLGYPRWKLIELLRLSIRYLAARLKGDATGIHAAAWRLYCARGWLATAREQSRQQGS